MRLLRAFFHIHKARMKAGGPPWTIHREGQCLPSEHIAISDGVRVETHEAADREKQPACLVNVFARFLLSDGLGGHVFSNVKTRRGCRGHRS
jgi:hypothetical protein